MRSAAAGKDGEELLVEGTGLHIDSPGGRALVRDLSICLGRERVAVVGRNGVGKTSLLNVLGGFAAPRHGNLVLHARPTLVAQHPETFCVASVPTASRNAWERELAALGVAPVGWSHGERRKAHLAAAKVMVPELLLLDEPTEDLDERGVDWLLQWLDSWQGGLVVVSHDRKLLRTLENFFRVSETGCTHFHGSFESLEQALAGEEQKAQRRYAASLQVMVHREEHNDRINRRRRRKKNVGRIREEKRAPSRAKLNGKRGYAQVSQGRVAKIQKARIGAVRSWARGTRRALDTCLATEVRFAPLLPFDGNPVISLRNVGAVANGRVLFEGLALDVGRERIAVTGPNGAGKTTLLEIMTRQRGPAEGAVRTQGHRVGYVAQGGGNWMLAESLASWLCTQMRLPSVEGVAEVLVTHGFPLALAQRPLASLSPGERVRAALIALCHRDPLVDVLVLDEPTFSLDIHGVAALLRTLRAWAGGLVVASHEAGFVADLAVDVGVVLDGCGGLRLQGRAAVGCPAC